MSRILQEIRKVHKGIGEKANRYGRTFQYTYHLEGYADKASPYSERRSGRSQRGVMTASPMSDMVKTEQTGKSSAVKLVQDLNEKSMEQIKTNIVQKKYQDLVRIFTDPHTGKVDEQRLLIDYFRHIITLHTAGPSATLKGRRTLTTQHLDRYIFCINQVVEKGFIPLLDLIKDIRTQLEGNRGYSIDKKTVRRIVEHLEAEQLLCTKDVKVTVMYGQG